MNRTQNAAWGSVQEERAAGAEERDGEPRVGAAHHEGIGIEKPALTHELISEGGSFTVCTIAREDRAIVRKFTKPVEVDEASSTLNGFPFHDGLTGAPILDQAPAYVDCEVRQAVEVGNHTFFIGEVVDCGFQAAEDTEVLRMEDTRMSYGG